MHAVGIRTRAEQIFVHLGMKEQYLKHRGKEKYFKHSLFHNFVT